MRLVVIVAALMAGCATAKPAFQVQGITDPVMKVETNPLPPRPDTTPLTDVQNQSYPVVKGMASPADGIVITPEKAARVLKIKIGYDELRTRFEYDRFVFAQNRVVYEDRIKQANEQIKISNPSWWDTNKGIVGFIGGMVLGAGMAAGVSIGLLHAQ